MPDVTPALAAEDLDAYVIPSTATVREDRAEVTLIDSGGPSALLRWATRVRFGASDIDGDIASVRAWFRARGHDAFTWKLGAHTTPTELEARLRAHGAHVDEAEPEHTAMVLDHEPPGVDGVDVRPVESLEDYLTSIEIMTVAFGGSFTTEEQAALRERAVDRYAAYRDDPTGRRYLAWVDGVPVAMGSSAWTTAGVIGLTGGSTLPEGRGKGAYRALVRARWDEAVRDGTPILVTQASEMSRPILERLGFRAVGPVIELIDSSAD